MISKMKVGAWGAIEYLIVKEYLDTALLIKAGKEMNFNQGIAYDSLAYIKPLKRINLFHIK